MRSIRSIRSPRFLLVLCVLATLIVPSISRAAPLPVICGSSNPSAADCVGWAAKRPVWEVNAVAKIPGKKVSVQVPGTSTAAASETCWWVDMAWDVKNYYGNRLYTFEEYIEWCSTSSQITRVVDHQGWGYPAGGFHFDGFTPWNQSPPRTTVMTKGQWAFHFCCPYGPTYNPHTQIYLHNGWLEGTVWSN